MFRVVSCARCGGTAYATSVVWPYTTIKPEGWHERVVNSYGVSKLFCGSCTVAIDKELENYERKAQDASMDKRINNLKNRVKNLEELSDRLSKLEEKVKNQEELIDEEFDMMVDEFSGKVMTDDSIITVTFYDLNMETGLARKINIESTKKPQLKPEDKNLMYGTTGSHTLWSYEDIFKEDEDEDMPT